MMSWLLIGSGGYLKVPVGSLIRPNGDRIANGVTPNKGKIIELSPKESGQYQRQLLGVTSDATFVDRQLAEAIAYINSTS